MSDMMLQGVLRMPPNCWTDSPLDVMQRHARYVQAADYIDALIAERDALRTAYLVLAEFAKTAPGRLPERVQAALLLSAEKGG
jgi:hypothetical protein